MLRAWAEHVESLARTRLHLVLLGVLDRTSTYRVSDFRYTTHVESLVRTRSHLVLTGLLSVHAAVEIRL